MPLRQLNCMFLCEMSPWALWHSSLRSQDPMIDDMVMYGGVSELKL